MTNNEIGIIIEEMMDNLIYMYEKDKTLSDKDLDTLLIFINAFNTKCKRRDINLGIKEEYTNYIKERMPYL